MSLLFLYFHSTHRLKILHTEHFHSKVGNDIQEIADIHSAR